MGQEDMDSVQHSAATQERNRIATFCFCSALFGFVAAIYLGAFAVSELKELPAWISAIAALASVIISAFAVYLVAGTLKATVSTLEITKEMAAAQSEAYDTEFRPQIIPDEATIRSVSRSGEGDFEVSLGFVFRNYGKMAALRVTGQILAGDVSADEQVDMEAFMGFFGVALFRRSTLRPEGTFSERVVVRGHFKDGIAKLVSPRLQYDDERGRRHFDIEKTYYFVRRIGDEFSISEVGVFDISPHADFDDG